jgi:hypothetical protein
MPIANVGMLSLKKLPKCSDEIMTMASGDVASISWRRISNCFFNSERSDGSAVSGRLVIPGAWQQIPA